MPNSYFQYKQFTVHQDRCAMKVCTDSSLFGAVVESEQATSILDIGTGTGLLALMQAQKASDAIIDAVEIDEAASIQAGENFMSSAWSHRLNAHRNDIVDFASTSSIKYDLILSNPPFFKQNLKSKNDQVNLARHDDGLTLQALCNVVQELLSSHGTFWLLLPAYEFSQFEELAIGKLSCTKRISVRNQSHVDKLRVIGCFMHSDKCGSSAETDEIVIKKQDQSYTDQFKMLLKDFYLPF